MDTQPADTADEQAEARADLRAVLDSLIHKPPARPGGGSHWDSIWIHRLPRAVEFFSRPSRPVFPMRTSPAVDVIHRPPSTTMSRGNHIWKPTGSISTNSVDHSTRCRMASNHGRFG